MNKHALPLLSASLALFPAAVLALRLPAFGTGLDHSQDMFIFLLSFILHVYSTILAGSLRDGLWSGYIRMAAIGIWVMLGLEAALLLILGGGLAYLLIQWFRIKELQPAFYEAAGRIAISGLALLGAHGVHQLLDGGALILPELPYFNIPVMAVVMFSHTVITHTIGLLVSQRNIRAHLQMLVHDIPFDLLLILVTFVVPLIFLYVGPISFVVVYGIALMQVTRYHTMQHTQTILEERVRAITLLNELGRQISSESNIQYILSSTYQMVHKLTEAPLFFVALVQEADDSLRFPLVMRDGQKQQWEDRPQGSSIVDYVVRQRQSICISTHETARMAQLGIDPASVTEAVYLCIPLQVGEKLLGAMGVAHPDNPQAFLNRDLELFETVAAQLALALRNAILYDRTTRMGTHLSYINQSLQNVMFNLNREDAMRTACATAAQVGEAAHAAIYMLDSEDASRMNLHQSSGSMSHPEFPASILYEPELFAQQSMVTVNGSSLNKNEWDQLLQQGQICCLTQIPLRNGLALMGVLILFHETPILYNDAEINLLENLANQIGAALDNVDLLQSLETYAAEQGQLLYLANISSSNLDLKRILFDVCQLLSQMSQMPQVEIALFAPDNREPLLYKPAPQGEEMETVPISPDLIPEWQQFLTQQHSLLVFSGADYPDTSHISAGMWQFLEEHAAATLILLPMHIAAYPIGFILLWSKESRIVPANTRRMLEMATHQIVAQIQNAQTYTVTESALRQGLQQLSLIETIARKISQSLDLPTIISHVLEASLQATQAELAAIVLRPSTTSQDYEVIWTERITGQMIPHHISLNTTAGIASHIMRTGETMIVPDNSAMEPYYPIPGTRYQYRSSLLTPLIKGEQIIGVLDIESTRLDYFNDDQARFIQSLAGHAAISIDNAYLLDDREHQINTLTLLRTLALETLNVNQEEEIADHILRIALTLLNGSKAALYRYDRVSDHSSMIRGAAVQHGAIVPADLIVPQVLMNRAMRTGILQIVSDAAQSESYRMSGYSNPTDYNSIVVIPIRRHDTIQELLCVAFSGISHFSNREVNTFDLLAVQIANHLENAALNETIQTSNDRMRTILDSNHDGIILLDMHSCVQDANAAAEQILSIALRQHSGERLLDLLRHSKQDEIAPFIAACEQGMDQIDACEFLVLHESSIQYIKARTYTVSGDEGIAGHVVVLRDITTEHDAQEFRNKIQSMILHDLRSPLSSIISSMYLAMSIIEMPGDDPLEETLVPTLEISLESANNLMQLVDTLRDLPLMTQIVINPVQIRLHTLALDAFNSLASTLREASIQVTYDLPPDLPDLLVDSDLIRRVFINLLHNAFKFTPENGRILISATTTGAPAGFMTVMVSDTGPGIPPDQRERIFQEFVQIEGRKPRAGGRGMGLGLNFCKLAVEAHGGQIRVEPQGPLSGACFAFTIPCASSDSSQIAG